MTDKTDLIREIHEYVATHGGENTATHLLVQAASAIQTQAAELEAVGAFGVQALQPEGGPPGSGGWQHHAETMERERDHWRERARTMEEHQRGTVWYWQGDGNDHPESMVNSLPVVIRADQLRALIASGVQALSAAPALSSTEQAWVLRSPAAIAELLTFIDLDHSQGVSMLGPEGCPPWPPKRYTDLKEIGRKIIEQDPDCFDAELLRTFGVAPPTPTAEQQAQPGAVYAELPVPALQSKQCDSTMRYTTLSSFSAEQMLHYADRTHALRMEQAAPKAAPGEPTQEFEKWLATYSTLSAARDVNGYADLTTEMLWHAWQAAAKTKAPEGASAEWIDANARPGLALTNYTCAHDFSVQPSSGIRLCQKCGISETAARKAAPQQEAQEPVAYCPYCNGSGETLVMDGAGPDAQDVPANCPHCGGSGLLADAYQGAVRLLRQKERDYLYCCAKLYMQPKTAPQPAPAPLSDERVKEIMRENGYDDASAQHRADFINGIRCAEVAHGIGAALAAQGGKDAG